MMRLADIETPALLVDLDVMERNLQHVADYTRQHGLRLRPHTKTHKSPRIGRRQLDLGAAGLTVAKVGEAEVMLDADPPDLLVAYPVIGRAKLERLMAIARRARVSVSLDSAAVADYTRQHGLRLRPHTKTHKSPRIGRRRTTF
jgi:D-serine deaminase-like pyridoxal phosphate-dependent protein